MEISLTKEKYLALMKLVYLGSWMANAFRTDDVIKEFNGLESHILSFAGKFGFGEYSEYDERSKKHFPTSELEETVDEFIDDYNEDIFWEELAYRLAYRDLEHSQGSEALKNMDRMKYFELEASVLEKYFDEFEKNGLDRLEISNE